MRYDTEDKEYYFNTQMQLSEDERQNVHDHYYDYVHGVFRDPIGAVRHESDRNRQSGIHLNGFQIALTILILVGVIGLIASAVSKRLDIAAWFVCGIMVFTGIVMIAGASSVGSYKSYVQSPVIKRIEGLIVIAAAGVLAYLRINEKYFNTSEMFIWIFVLAFGACSLIMLLQTIGQAVAPKAVYNEQVNAECIGYIRTYDSEGKGHLHMKNSPVFEYYYQGEKYQSAYDILTGGANGKIPVGSSTVINIDPRNPDHVMGNSRSLAVVFGVITVVCMLVTGFCIYLLTSGMVDEGTMHVSGIAAPKYESMISDDLIDKEYGTDWYIEKTKIGKIEERELDGQKYLHVVIDDSYKEIDTYMDFQYKEGEEVYIIYSMEQEDGVLKKKVLNFVKAEGVGYMGKHKAYKP